jgi:hypothetical protein
MRGAVGPGVAFQKEALQYDRVWRSAMMDTTFDIFKKLPDGHPIWVKAVDGLEEAKRQMMQMSDRAPGNYFICNLKSGRVFNQ